MLPFSVEIYMRVNNIVPKHFSVMIWLFIFLTKLLRRTYLPDKLDISLERIERVSGNNMDISLWGNEITPIAPFIKKIDEFDIIHTDRLHVAILACLLHKRVHFYKGGYFKNEAVFRSSMKDYFDDVFMKNY